MFDLSIDFLSSIRGFRKETEFILTYRGSIVYNFFFLILNSIDRETIFSFFLSVYARITREYQKSMVKYICIFSGYQNCPDQDICREQR